MSRLIIAMRWLPALAWMGVLFWLSGSPEVPGGIELSDKLEHFGVYAVLGALLWWAAARARACWPAAALTCIVGALYAACDEAHQHWVRGRTADVRDWVADVAGIAMVVLIALALRYRRARGDG